MKILYFQSNWMESVWIRCLYKKSWNCFSWRKGGKRFRVRSLAGSSSGWRLRGHSLRKPTLILADEPTGDLDTATGHDVLGLLKIVAKQFRQTIVLITHDNDIAQMADQLSD